MPTFQLSMVSDLTGCTNIMDFPREREDDILEWLSAGSSNRPRVHQAFPDLSLPQRQFLVTGVTPEEMEAGWGKKPTIGVTVKHGTVTNQEVRRASQVLEMVANGEQVHLTNFGDGVNSGLDETIAMIIRELSTEKQIREFLNRHGISVV